jgi:hypothetical protein
VSSRQTWDRDAPTDTAKIQVMVRCQVNRVIGAGLQDRWLHMTVIFSRRAVGNRLLPPGTRLSHEFTRESGRYEVVPLGPYECPNHKEGHRIDGARLREVIYRLSPRGRTKKRGKVPSVDIKTIELA